MGILTKIVNRFDGSLIFQVEINGDTEAIRLGLAVKLAYNSGADLSGADLSGADLSRADLSGANNINKYICTPLMILYDQPGKIRAYKLVTRENKGPHYPVQPYKIGETYDVEDACCDDSVQCGSGINLATLDWCLREWSVGYKILIAEFEAKDIAAIPIATDGKFRVHRCKIVGAKDLTGIGLIRGD